ncbi:MAG TPA: S9 family peptidase [Thermotogota bacterium]|nr:MAG: Prolyl tripeptidyl peptidase precursor [Thermotogota bacterium ADurb.Bin062]HNW47523.1 S9 family peptidase [Thermotogota bacterium]HNY82866.1 S9 family peptidase [Thermotogota bacterium]HOD91493.1 S9 family peptidase [Thermotogota bacterium]HOH12754.1 S9 family peptidase [Thermotogota bacterium]
MEPLKMDDLTKYTFLSGPALSPDGETCAFAAHQMDLAENEYRSDIWCYRLSDRKLTQMTTSHKDGRFIWLSDGRRLLFSSLREKEDIKAKESGEVFTQFYTISLDGGEAQKAFRVPFPVSSITEINPDLFLLEIVWWPPFETLAGAAAAEKPKLLQSMKEETDYEVLDEIPFWSNGEGFTNKKRTRLYLYDVKTKDLSPITGETFLAETPQLDETHERFAFTGIDFSDKLEIRNDVYLYTLKDKSLEKFSMGETFLTDYVDFWDKDTLFVVGQEQRNYGINENPKFYAFCLKDKTLRCLTPELDLAPGNALNSDCRYGGGSKPIQKDGEAFYFLATEGVGASFKKICPDGTVETVAQMKGSLDSFSIKKGKLAFIGFHELKLAELYTFSNQKFEAVTDFNGWVLRERTLSNLERLVVKADEKHPTLATDIDGWLIRPVPFDPDKTYPGILMIHGGPKTTYGENFIHEMQWLANEGYAVFFCNPRGSEGRGNAFADVRGKYGTIDFDDLMAFTDEVLERYSFLDPARIGVTGGSYGGFMTNWIIGHTDRFRAAVSQRSIANWVSKFCTTDIGYFFVPDQNSATPWSDVDKLWEHSPLKYADRVKTPTLFIHSEQDYRCWLPEGIQMFTALKYHGVDSRLCLFRGENHELSRSGKPKHRLRRLKEIKEWFDRYLK